MKYRMLFALLCLMTVSACKAQKNVVDFSHIMDLFSYKPVIAVGDNEEVEARQLMDRAIKSFTGNGFTQGLTGDGYGGPCVIIDGFYKGGEPNKEIYAFEPGQDLDNACVVEMSACNDGDGGDYQLYVTVQLFSKRSSAQFMHQFGQYGFNFTELPKNKTECSFSNGTIAIDYSLEEGFDPDIHYFIIQTEERKAGMEMPVDETEKDYQGEK